MFDHVRSTIVSKYAATPTAKPSDAAIEKWCFDILAKANNEASEQARTLKTAVNKFTKYDGSLAADSFLV